MQNMYEFHTELIAESVDKNYKNILSYFNNTSNISIDNVKKEFPIPRTPNKQMIIDYLNDQHEIAALIKYWLLELNASLFQLHQLNTLSRLYRSKIKIDNYNECDIIPTGYKFKSQIMNIINIICINPTGSEGTMMEIISYYNLFEFHKEIIHHCEYFFEKMKYWYRLFDITLALKGGNIEFIQYFIHNYYSPIVDFRILESNNFALFFFCFRCMVENKNYDIKFLTLEYTCELLKHKCPKIYNFLKNKF